MGKAPTLGVQEVLSRLDGVKEAGDGWKARCPAHEDHRASLSVHAGQKGILIKCFAGCAFADVVAALGLEPTQLFAHEDEPNRRNGARPKKADLGRIVATYDYTDAEGRLLYQAVRFEPKDFRQRRSNGAGGWIWNLAGVDLVLYRYAAVQEAIAAAVPIWIVEGEKDVHALEAFGFVATTNAMGAGKWRKEYSQALAGARCIILRDNDPAGHNHVLGTQRTLGVAPSLHDAGCRVRVLDLPGLSDHGDVSDWIAAGGTRDQLIELAKQTPDWEPTEEHAVGVGDRLDLQEAIDLADADSKEGEGQRGPSDETLARHFAAERQLWLMYMDGDQWFFYQRSGAWVRRNYEYVEKMMFDWMDAKKRDGEKITISARRISNVIQLAKNRLGPHDMDEMDARSDWIPLRNGIYDLSSGKLLTHGPANKIIQIHPYDYNPEAACERWMLFLNETLVEEDGSPCLEWHGLLQEFAGYLLVPTARAQTSMFWLGGGSNGKGVAQKVLEHMVGEAYVAAVLVNKLDDPYHLADLHGKLFGTISEIDRRALREKGQMLKAIIGGDRVSARRPRENVFGYNPVVRILVACNEMPRTDDTTQGYFRRIMPMLWRREFTEANRDPLLAEKLRDEAGGIFNWALVGLERLKARGWRFELPEASKRLLQEYRLGEDSLHRFVAEECEQNPKAGIHTATFYREYCRYCDEGGEKDRALRLVDVRKRLQGMGYTPGRPYVGGVQNRGFFGLKLSLGDQRCL